MRIHETLVHGHSVVILESDVLSLTVAAGKGADIVSMIYKPTDTEFLWQSPSGMNVLQKPRSEIRYIGGWIETFPNAWDNCSHQGRLLTGYGDVWQLPWNYRIIRCDQEVLQVEFTVQSKEAPLHLQKAITLCAGDPAVCVEETVFNNSQETIDFTWGHHPNIGRPFLTEQCVIELPPCDIMEAGRKVGEWPYILGNSGYEDISGIPEYGTSSENRQVFLGNLSDSWAAVRNRRTGLSFKLSWDRTVFTELLLWRAFHTEWSEMFGDYQIVCFFPKRSHYHVADAAYKGESLTLEPGNSLSSWIKAQVEDEHL